PPVGDTLSRALGEEPLHPTLVEMLASAGIALAVLALAWWRPAPQPRWARGWLGLEPVTRAGVVLPTLALAQVLARFDDRVLDRVVTGAASGALGLARRAAWFDDRVLDSAVELSSGVTVEVAQRAGRADDRWFDGAAEELAAR